jgi:hypothetical protein
VESLSASASVARTSLRSLLKPRVTLSCASAPANSIRRRKSPNTNAAHTTTMSNVHTDDSAITVSVGAPS